MIFVYKRFGSGFIIVGLFLSICLLIVLLFLNIFSPLCCAFLENGNQVRGVVLTSHLIKYVIAYIKMSSIRFICRPVGRGRPPEHSPHSRQCLNPTTCVILGREQGQVKNQNYTAYNHSALKQNQVYSPTGKSSDGLGN